MRFDPRPGVDAGAALPIAQMVLIIAVLTTSTVSKLDAADVTATIPETSLTDFALAVGSVGGAGVHSLELRYPSLPYRTLHTMFLDPSFQSGELQQLVRPAYASDRVLEITVQQWSWSVAYPRFRVESSGIRMAGQLAVQLGGKTVLQSFDLPVSVSYDPGTAEIELEVSNRPLTVHWVSAGRHLQLGQVRIGSYFGTSLRLGSERLNVSGRSVKPRVRNVQISLLPGNIRITNDLDF